MEDFIKQIVGDRQLSPEEQFFTSIALGRILIELGLSPDTAFGLVEYDAGALLQAHVAQRQILPPDLLRKVIAISRGEMKPNPTTRRAIDKHMARLLARARAITDAMMLDPIRESKQ